MTKNELKEAMKAAMKNKEPIKLNVLRGLLSALTNEAVTKGRGPEGELSDEEVLAVIARAAKQRKDSIRQFEAGCRPELAASEKEELAIIETMLPAQLSRAEVEAKVKAKAAELGVADKSEAHKLMGALMRELKGVADGTMVKEVVDSLFA